MASNQRPKRRVTDKSRTHLQFHYELDALGHWYRVWSEQIDEASSGVADLAEYER